MDKDRFADPYNTEDFIERVSFQHLGGSNTSDEFDPTPLVKAFESSIGQLYELNADVAREILELEKVVGRKENGFSDNIAELGFLTDEATQALGELSTGTKGVTHKIVHIGDSLESKHLQRSRATDTKTVMEHFSAFQLPGGPLLPPFVGDAPDLHACAEIIEKLHFIASQLPPKQFADPSARIKKKLKEIESRLLVKFSEATGDIAEMRAYARTLFPFESYGACVEDFISQFINSRRAELETSDTDVPKIMAAIERTCEEAKITIEHVFKYPHAVSITFIQTIVKEVLGRFVSNYVMAVQGEYLDRLHTMYERTREMLDRLSKRLQVSDPGGLLKGNLLRQVFEDYLQSYITMEEEWLAASYEENVEEVLGAARPVQLSATAAPSRAKKIKGRRAKTTAAGMVAPASSGTRTLGQSSPADLLAGGNLLRQEVALTMIHENQRALRRCEALVAPSALPDLANRIFQTLLQGLGVAYMKVSLELATDAISSKSDLKKNVELSIHFLNVVEDANSIVYLLMKHFWDKVLPLVRPSINVYQACVNQKTAIMQQLELLISNGLNQTLGAVVNHCAMVLAKQQKKTDFAPSDDSMAFTSGTSTEACRVCCEIIARHTGGIKQCLNGKNEDNIFVDLSQRIYTMVVDHFKTLTVNEMGAMLLIRDLNEYEQCINGFKSKEADELFACLKEASAVLIVPAEHVGQLGDENRMSRVSQKLQHTFAKLRQDYKAADLSRFFTDFK